MTTTISTPELRAALLARRAYRAQNPKKIRATGITVQVDVDLANQIPELKALVGEPKGIVTLVITDPLHKPMPLGQQVKKGMERLDLGLIQRKILHLQSKPAGGTDVNNTKEAA